MDPSIRWGVPQARATLMIPGPTELPWPVIQAMSQPPMIQYDQHFDVKILEPVTLGLREVFQTSESEVIVMPGSGRTALESSAVSLIEPGDPVVVIAAGQFGNLMREIMTRAGAEVTEFAVQWGQPIDLAKLQKEIERVKPKAVTLVHNETSTGTTYPAAGPCPSLSNSAGITSVTARPALRNNPRSARAHSFSPMTLIRIRYATEAQSHRGKSAAPDRVGGQRCTWRKRALKLTLRSLVRQKDGGLGMTDKKYSPCIRVPVAHSEFGVGDPDAESGSESELRVGDQGLHRHGGRRIDAQRVRGGRLGDDALAIAVAGAGLRGQLECRSHRRGARGAGCPGAVIQLDVGRPTGKNHEPAEVDSLAAGERDELGRARGRSVVDDGTIAADVPGQVAR